MSPADRLRALQEELTEYFPPRHDREYGHSRIRRKATQAEWEEVQAIIKSEKLVCLPHNAGMGFNFGISLYSTPVYPGTPCEFLLTLEGNHFGERFSDAFDRLSPFSHNPENVQLLALYGFKPPEEKSHYEY